MSKPSLYCSFCGSSQHEVGKLIAGPGAYICDGCVVLAGGVTGSGHPAATRFGQLRAVPEHDTQTTCSFCGKRRDRAAGPALLDAEPPSDPAIPHAICTECQDLCREIIEEELSEGTS